MAIHVHLEDKKVFLSWFLEKFQLKRRESMWILNYLLNHDVVMTKVHFVEHASETDRGIKMSTIGTDEEPFSFYKDGMTFQDPEQAFHEVRLNWHDDLYIELIFEKQQMEGKYLKVLEDNPFYRWNDQIDEAVYEEVDELLENLALKGQKQSLLKEIDMALEAKDKKAFLNLSKSLYEVEKQMK